MPAVIRNSDWVREVGGRLRLFADRKGLPYKELAKEIGANQSRISNWLAGRTIVDISAAVALYDRFNVPLDWLYLNKRGSLPRDLDELLYPTLK